MAFALLLSILLPLQAWTQETKPAGARGTGRMVEALPCETDPPLIDGRLDDAVWQRCAPTGGFLQKEPLEGTPATLGTQVRFCYDDDALYIGAVMSVDDPAEIVSTLSRRDNAGNSERLILSFDSYNDNRTAYTFGITADGVRLDYYHPVDQEFNRDYSYDPVWEAKVTRGDTAWVAEMRIPFSQLRFNARELQLWGLNMNRFIPSRNEDVYWVLIPKNETGWSSRFGSLSGIRDIAPSSRIEITPYSVADVTISRTGSVGDPFHNRIAWRAGTGLDMKMGLGPNLTLDATVNPDFGQVEADPAEVNLSAYETYYAERRPFFIEGSRLLTGEGPEYFYSRRIGAPPKLSPDAAYAEQPSNTNILGAAKISGRLRSGLSIAALTALTEREFVDTYDPVTGFSEAMIEPLTGYGAMRVQQEFGVESSTLGASITGVKRDLGTPQAEARLTRQAVSGGLDWRLRFDKATYELTGYTGFSHVAGSTDAISLLQRSSARYYQRPDADYVEYDPESESLAGYTFGLNFAKNGGEHWLWGAGISAESPGFEINDAGILRTADDIDGYVKLAYRENTPSTLLHSYRVEASTSTGWNFGLVRQYTNVGFDLNATLRNFYQAELEFDFGTAALNDHLTRGGPLMRSGNGWNVYARLNNSYAEDLRWNVWGTRFTDALGSWNWGTGAWVGLRTSGRFELSIEPSFIRSVNTRQYVATIPGGGVATFGSRYIFATIDQGTLSARFRLNYAFSPDLSLECYAEPFAASGAYSAFGKLSAAESDQLRLFGADSESSIRYDEATGTYEVTDEHGSFGLPDVDFHILSFRSNIVLRWEWVRGSTLFLVWSQNRSGYERNRMLIGPDDLFRSFDSRGDDFIALKISYWIPVS
ncbi:MAG: carbohydrate binding family 9 domain-containing protein [Bacteroidetes bacterium]|nr:carbohydrate binding family 9 domain-containing protein [Bacteroidota bacterium]